MLAATQECRHQMHVLVIPFCCYFFRLLMCYAPNFKSDKRIFVFKNKTWVWYGRKNECQVSVINNNNGAKHDENLNVLTHNRLWLCWRFALASSSLHSFVFTCWLLPKIGKIQIFIYSESFGYKITSVIFNNIASRAYNRVCVTFEHDFSFFPLSSVSSFRARWIIHRWKAVFFSISSAECELYTSQMLSFFFVFQN